MAKLLKIAKTKDVPPGQAAPFTIEGQKISGSGYQEPPRSGGHGHGARHEFVPESLRKFAYWDEPLPIGYGQSISQPFIVAFITDNLTPNRLIESSRSAPDPDTRPLFFRGL